MEKPKKFVETIEYYDYMNVMKYLESIYESNEDRLCHSFQKDIFWKWVIKRYNINNDSDFYLYFNDVDENDDIVYEIASLIKEHFGEKKDAIQFYVSW